MRVQPSDSLPPKDTGQEIPSGTSALARRIYRVGQTIFSFFCGSSPPHSQEEISKLYQQKDKVQPLLQILHPILQGKEEGYISLLFTRPLLVDELLRDLPLLQKDPSLGKIAMLSFLGTAPAELPSLEAQKIALKYATLGGDLSLLSRYLTSMPHLVHEKDQRGSSLVHMAALGGHTGLVDALIEELGFSSKERDDEGNTPLHYATQQGQMGAASLLLYKYKADPYQQNRQGKTSVYLAQEGDHKELAKELETGGLLVFPPTLEKEKTIPRTPDTGTSDSSQGST
ncbi:MAG: ankyrin repeat domain-containing protein [Chlamydiae bacterium]|nr:ankyrin repeat domain-containing protein [Chlamydiota bacterium]